MALRTWRERLWFGLAVAIGPSVALLIGPAFLRPLPIWAKLVILVVGCGFIATVAIYSRRRARRASSL
jgi:uncharacterized membrane protein